MYWQKRFDKDNSDKEIEEEILSIRKEHKDYGYIRIHKEPLNRDILINKKKVQRLVIGQHFFGQLFSEQDI